MNQNVHLPRVNKTGSPLQHRRLPTGRQEQVFFWRTQKKGIEKEKMEEYDQLTMKAKLKILSLFIVFFYVVPVIFASCCCAEASPVLTTSPSTVHAGCSGHHENSTNSGHKQDQCEHSKIVADLSNINPNVLPFLISNGPAFKNFSSKFLPILHTTQSLQSSRLFFDTGPPGVVSSSTPLYLTFSTLRI